MSNTEELLNALIGGASIDSFIPASRVEQILVNCVNKNGLSNCEPPMSIIEALLQELSLKLTDGTNIPIDISASDEMNALLVEANVGKVYRFTGTTDSNYTNGDIYVVKEV